MPEPLTSQLVSELLRTLLVAFPRNLGARDPALMADVYRNGLSGLSGDAVRFAVDRAIKEDQYFPKVGRLRELGDAWTRRNAPSLPYVPRGDDPWLAENTCRICGAQPVNRYEVREPDGTSTWVESERTYVYHDRKAHGIKDPSPDDEV